MFICKICGEPLEIQSIETIWEQFSIDKTTGEVNWDINLMEDQPGSGEVEIKVCCSDNPEHNCGYVYDPISSPKNPDGRIVEK